MYESKFHVNRHRETVYAANQILSLLIEKIPKISSAVDIGCGVGTFLSVLCDKGVNKIQGIDGDWVDESMLMIGREQFLKANLVSPPSIDERYDLAICLEVAEHLPIDAARNFIKWLCKLSNVILFSAAIPGQGGENHFNESWQSYWVQLFEDEGYVTNDFIRSAIWQDEKIPFWYRQNIFVFTKHPHRINCQASMPIDIVHPELYRAQQAGGTYYGRISKLVKNFLSREIIK